MRTLLLLLLVTITTVAQTAVTVSVDKPGAAIQNSMWGVFFEDINYGADGGLYPELVKNKSFEFDVPLMGWKEENTDKFSNNATSGAAQILRDGNQRFARLTIHNDKTYSLTNEGFFGMGVKKGVAYHFTVWARPMEGQFTIKAELLDDRGQSLGSTIVQTSGSSWTAYKGDITPTATFAKARLRLTFTGKGKLDIDKVSLFPSDTWKGRSNGLRADLVQLLYDLKPGFLRFPGGCIVEGRDLANRYQWKNTVGPADDRKLMINRWNNEFKHRPAPDYFQSFGLGFFEYFQLAEDIGASPLPILNCGMACQFNTAELVPVNDLDPYIQDALDLIEFANGAVTTRWGKLRADMGHPAPFGLTMLGVGNEQWGVGYMERYVPFAKAIKAKYPDIRIVSGSGPGSDGEMFDYGWEELRKQNADIVDEHYYKNPDWFLKNAGRYDSYDRKGPKIFAGEYAAQSVDVVSPDNRNTWYCALSEAAFMTGLERNADVVHLASYAPLFAHAEGWQWTPDLIWFNNLQAYGTANYYVQKMFANYRGTKVLPVASAGQVLKGQNGMFASAVWDDRSSEVVVKLVNAGEEAKSVVVELAGATKLAKEAKLLTMTGGKDDVNSFEKPLAVSPKESTAAVKGRKVTVQLPARSFVVVRAGKG